MRVGFTAALTHPLTGLTPGSIIAFNGITLNLGDAYNNNTGVFTCPVDGNYFFMTSLMSGYNTKIHAEIVLQDIPLAAVYSQSSKLSEKQTHIHVLAKMPD